jgi:hypothetical protein
MPALEQARQLPLEEKMRHSLICAIALAALVSAGQSLAQPADQNPCTDLTAHLDARLSFLHTKLAITSSQESAFSTYAAAVKAASNPVAVACASLPSTLPTAFPDKFDVHTKLLAAHVQEMTTLSPANKVFYAALTSAQQAILDRDPGPGPGH